MNTEDTNLAIRCLTLAANLQDLDSLMADRRAAALAEAAVLMELVAGVFLEPEPPLPSLN